MPTRQAEPAIPTFNLQRLTGLPVFGSLCGGEYEWDAAEAAANLVKHGISFTAAARGLDHDPRKIETLDDWFDHGEERVQSLCMDRGKILFVVTAMRDENICRIISARKATRHEEKRYFQGGPLSP